MQLGKLLMAHCERAQRVQTGLDKPVDAMPKTISCHSGLTAIAPLVVDMLHGAPADGLRLLCSLIPLRMLSEPLGHYSLSSVTPTR